MDSQIFEWLNLLFRWFHVITAIAWIGSSFYFIWLDLSLEEPPEEKRRRGLGGELWSIHGGGFYEVGKYQLFPPKMPANLHWFKWEAYSTWLSGSGLLVLMYYLNAQSYLIGADSWIDTPGQATLASLAFLAVGFALYELLARSKLTTNMALFTTVLLVLLGLACFLAFQLFSGRAAILHVGALMATIMAGNVFFGIIPAQKLLVAAFESGEAPDPTLAQSAKRRSTHNNYFTLPVILCMVANHYPFLYGQEWSWVLVIALSLNAAYARHFFNLKHQGSYKPQILVISAVVFTALLAANQWITQQQQTTVEQTIQSDAADRIVATHCANCHAQQPTFPGYTAPPGGFVFDQADRLLTHSGKVVTALQTKYMPLGNLSQMTEDERAQLIDWVNTQSGK